MTMTLIETKTLATAAAVIEFAAIPQDGTDIVAFMSLRTDQAGAESDMSVQFNSSTTGFTQRYLAGGGGAGVFNGSSSTGSLTVSTPGGGATANIFSNNMFYVSNYSSSINKNYNLDGVVENNSTTAWQLIQTGFWSNTAAITNLKFLTLAGNFIIGSSVSLYKITKGSDGIVTTS